MTRDVEITEYCFGWMPRWRFECCVGDNANVGRVERWDRTAMPRALKLNKLFCRFDCNFSIQIGILNIILWHSRIARGNASLLWEPDLRDCESPGASTTRITRYSLSTATITTSFNP